MFSHIMLGTTDVDRAEAFYTAALAPLGLVPLHRHSHGIRFGREEDDLPFLSVVIPFDDAPATSGNGSMVAFVAESRSAVHAAHENALAHGGTCEGPPGPRPDYGDHYYGAYFRDPDGNKLHVVCRKAEA